MNASDRYWIWLSSVTDADLSSKAALVSAFGNAEKAFAAEPGAFFHMDGISKKDAGLFEKRDLNRVDGIMQRCEAENIRIITIDSPEYPERLKNIYAPPYVLYVKGTLPEIDEEPVVAFVGTRQATAYGKRMSRDIAWQYAACGGMLASGLTSGIEECAAEAVLNAGGTVIAYLGTSVTEAKGELARRVTENGALISEYAPGTETQRFFFRNRNRIGSGISAAVCAVEAPLKSGTVLFVREALEQGRQIFSVPGNADSEASEGTLMFIKEGAMLVTNGKEIAAELAPAFPGKLDICRDVSAVPSKKVIDKKKTDCYSEKIDGILEGLSDIQKKIVVSVAGGCNTVDGIINDTGIPAPVLLSQLTLLEIKKRIGMDREKGIVLSPENI